MGNDRLWWASYLPTRRRGSQSSTGPSLPSAYRRSGGDRYDVGSRESSEYRPAPTYQPYVDRVQEYSSAPTYRPDVDRVQEYRSSPTYQPNVDRIHAESRTGSAFGRPLDDWRSGDRYAAEYRPAPTPELALSRPSPLDGPLSDMKPASSWASVASKADPQLRPVALGPERRPGVPKLKNTDIKWAPAATFRNQDKKKLMVKDFVVNGTPSWAVGATVVNGPHASKTDPYEHITVDYYRSNGSYERKHILTNGAFGQKGALRRGG